MVQDVLTGYKDSEKKDIRTTADMIVYELRRKIISGELPAGTQLKNTQLAEKFNTSITPVREALNRLEKLELTEYRPRCGWAVKSLDTSAMQEVYGMRYVLEMMAARVICSPGADVDISILRSYIDAYKISLDKGDVGRCMDLDVEFHCELVKFSHNRFAVEMMDRLRNLIQLIRFSENYASNNQKSHVEHMKIYDALQAKDLALVEKLLVDHVRICRTDLEPGKNKDK